jgi:hypothetical protein
MVLMRQISFLIIVLGMAIFSVPAHAQQAPTAIVTPIAPIKVTPPAPVVIELFSSQACTYCPAADAYMADLIKQDQVIGLSCHVDYFDVRQGSLSKKFCTKRQKNYADKFKLRSVYTPQMVVNGHMDVVGYEAGKVSVAILRARAEKMKPIYIAATPEGAYAYDIPKDIAVNPNVNLWLAMYDKPHTLKIAEGGNRGKTLTYHNVVTALTDLGAISRMTGDQTVLPMMNSKSAGFALLAQDRVSGKILAAGTFNRP